MADDYNIDNEGSGFAIEEGQDINSMLNAARAGEASEDNIATSWLFEDDGQPPQESVVEQPGQGATQLTREVEEAPAVGEKPPVEEVFPQPVSEEEAPELGVAPIQEVEEPAPFHAPMEEEAPVVQAPRPRMPSAKDELAKVEQVIRVLNAYRDLNRDEQEAVSQFVTTGNVLEDEAQFVVAVLNADRTLSKAMIALKEAKGLEAVDRAFYVIELPENLVYYLGSLIAVFTEEELDRKQAKGQYAKSLVRAIEKLDQKSMGYVHATASVLEASALTAG